MRIAIRATLSMIDCAEATQTNGVAEGIVRVDERLDLVHQIGDAVERTPLDRSLAE